MSGVSVGMEVERQPERDKAMCDDVKGGVMFDSFPAVGKVNKPCEFMSHQHSLETLCYCL